MSDNSENGCGPVSSGAIVEVEGRGLGGLRPRSPRPLSVGLLRRELGGSVGQRRAQLARLVVQRALEPELLAELVVELVELVKDRRAQPSSRVAAARLLLEYSAGKPRREQPAALASGGGPAASAYVFAGQAVVNAGPPAADPSS